MKYYKHKVPWPLSVKLISATIFFVAGVTASVTYITNKTVVDISSKRESDSNLEQAVAKAEEVSSLLYSYTTRAKLLGNILANKNDQSQQIIQSTFHNDNDFVSIFVFSINPKSQKVILSDSLIKKDFYLEHGVQNLDSISVNLQKNIKNIFSGELLVINRSFDIKAPIWTVAIPITETKNGEITQVAFADIKLSRLKKSFTQSGYRTLFLVDTKGQLLEHPEEKLLEKGHAFKKHPLVIKAISSPLKSSQSTFTDDKKVKWIGAFVKTSMGPIVFAQVKEKTILEPAYLIRNQVILIAGLSIAIAILFIFVLSLKITNPIEKLVSVMRLVSTGNLNIQINIKTGDEIELLSNSFMNMLEGLKERDKIKNVMVKFHGSKIAKNILKGNLQLGGNKQNAIIFFSDIRNFTSYCESHSPEDVVEMLNEYFGIMVNIINKYNGIVDKFIGDAIMAVWGVPENSPQDVENAINACLEMRKALDTFNKSRLARKKSEITIGMGLNEGSVISGTIGSSERMEYTIIGDSVNVASRIESATKTIGVDLLISENLGKTFANEFITEFSGTVEVKGKSQPLQLYSVLGKISNTGEREIIETPYSKSRAHETDVKIKVA